MAIFSGKIIEASYSNEKYTTIEILYKEENKIIPYYMEVNHSHPDFQELIKEYPLDKIRKTTKEKLDKYWENIKVAYKNDLETYKEKLKEKYGVTKIKYKWQDLLKHIENDNQDDLFRFKLELFEKDIIKNAPKNNQDKIRNAKTFIKVLQEYKKICSM